MTPRAERNGANNLMVEACVGPAVRRPRLCGVQAPALVNTTTLLLVAAFTAIEVWLSGDEEAVAEDLSHPLSISRQATPAASDSVTLGMAGTAHHEGLRHVGERLERLQRAVRSLCCAEGCLCSSHGSPPLVMKASVVRRPPSCASLHGSGRGSSGVSAGVRCHDHWAQGAAAGARAGEQGGLAGRPAVRPARQRCAGHHCAHAVVASGAARGPPHGGRGHALLRPHRGARWRPRSAVRDGAVRVLPPCACPPSLCTPAAMHACACFRVFGRLRAAARSCCQPPLCALACGLCVGLLRWSTMLNGGGAPAGAGIKQVALPCAGPAWAPRSSRPASSEKQTRRRVHAELTALALGLAAAASS